MTTQTIRSIAGSVAAVALVYFAGVTLGVFASIDWAVVAAAVGGAFAAATVLFSESLGPAALACRRVYRRLLR